MNAYVTFEHEDGQTYGTDLEITNDVVFDMLDTVNTWCSDFGYADIVKAAQDGWTVTVWPANGRETDVTEALASLATV